MDAKTLAACGLGLMLVLVLARAAVLPMRWLATVGYRACVGTACLWVGNLIAEPLLAARVAINPLTAALAGSLGLPGVLLLLFISWLVAQGRV